MDTEKGPMPGAPEDASSNQPSLSRRELAEITMARKHWGFIGADEEYAAWSDEQQEKRRAEHAQREQQAPPRRTKKPRQGAPKSEKQALMPCSLAETVEVFSRWLHLEDPSSVYVTAATTVANKAEGDPLWTLLVGSPSNGKTEVLSSVAGLDYVHSAATLTEASLLSGVANRDRDKDATGGLLKQVGEFGIILAKDFTSVLAQNRDTAKAAVAAMREIYDGRWDRPVGSGGGKVLRWAGKCGFVGGVTPSYDGYTTIVGTLGDRFLLLRLPDLDPVKMTAAALKQDGRQKQMRQEMAKAMVGLIESSDFSKVNRELSQEESEWLSRLAIYTARARTPVERDFREHIIVLPQAEGPARLVGQMRRLYGGLEAIGTDEETARAILVRVAVDCIPNVRAKVISVLIAEGGELKTGQVAQSAGVATNTARKYLEELVLLGLATQRREGDAEKTANWWDASDWLKAHYPPLLVRQSTYLKERDFKERPSSENSEQVPRAGDGTSPDKQKDLGGEQQWIL